MKKMGFIFALILACATINFCALADTFVADVTDISISPMGLISKITVEGDINQNLMGIVAVYDGDGRLSGISCTDIITEAGAFSLTNTETAVSGQIVKGFLWSLGNSVPYSEPYSYVVPEADGIIHLSDSGIVAVGIENVQIEGSTLTISDGGTYSIDGKLSDGQIIVSADDKADVVKLNLDNVTVCNSSVEPFRATKGCVELYLTGTNTFSDSDNTQYADLRENGCITSKNDLTIKSLTSGGKLVAYGNYENGIRCKNDLKIGNADILVYAKKTGIKGDDSVKITKKATNVTVVSGSDGIKTDYLPEIDTDVVAGGCITINGGIIDITSTSYLNPEANTLENGDGIQGDLNVTIANNPSITINSYGDGIKANASSIDESEIACEGGDGTINISGGGVTVIAGEDGIKSTKSIDISGGTINVDATGDGIQAGDIVYTDSTEATVSAFVPSAVSITGGEVIVDSKEDGISSQSGQVISNNVNGGTILISGGVVDVTSERDGIQADTTLYITDEPEITVLAHNGVTGQTTTESAKGLKAGYQISIDGGAIDINSFDDAIHSNFQVDISGGEINLKSTDDGVHGDSYLNILGGTIYVNESYEGIEAAEIYVSGGKTYIVSSDDGVNGAGDKPTDSMITPLSVENAVSLMAFLGQGTNPGGGTRPGGGVNPSGEDSSAYGYIEITDGLLYIVAEGDGFDSNGDAKISGGILLVNGPTSGGNGVFDVGDNGNTLSITGGTVIGEGTSSMMVNPSSGSQAYVVKTGISISAGGVFELSCGTKVIATYKAAKSGQYIFVSTPDMTSNTSYTLKIGGTYSGNVINGCGGYGMLGNGTYSGGTSYTIGA